MKKLNGDPNIPHLAPPTTISPTSLHFLLFGRAPDPGPFYFSHREMLPSAGILNHISFYIMNPGNSEVEVCLFSDPKERFNNSDFLDGFPLCDFLQDDYGDALVFTFSSSFSLIFAELNLPVKFDNQYLHLFVQPLEPGDVTAFSFLSFSDAF